MSVLQVIPIGLHWPTLDPFLFCAHHNDEYPAGNASLGVDQKHFKGRQMGSDFELKDGFRMYHGDEVPGFPVHPHRGFETITIVRKGYADHADSLGAAGRYGEGDVQWMTAGRGVQHSEMFPLVHKDKTNTVELFQIWLNLPKSKKMVDPDFKMLWANQIAKVKNDNFEVSIICGDYQDTKFNEAPMNSYAQVKNSGVRILLVKLNAGSEFKLEKNKLNTHRMLYFFEGSDIQIKGQNYKNNHALVLDSQEDLVISASDSKTTNELAEFLILEAVPLNEPVAQHGPFVMNSRQEIMQAFADYQNTQFGGWPWPRSDMVHGDEITKFALYPDGRRETSK